MRTNVHGTHIIHGTMDWCIIGYPYEDEFAVIASDTLGHAELRAVLDANDVLRPPLGKPFYPKGRYEMNVSMTDIFFATGRTYAEAVAHLFSQWEPKNQAHWQLDPPQESLPPG